MTSPAVAAQAEAVAAVRELQARGHAATAVRRAGRWAVLDLDGPATDVVDALLEIGFDLEEAEDIAARRLARGY